MIINYKALIYKHALLVYDHLSDIITPNPQSPSTYRDNFIAVLRKQTYCYSDIS